MRDNLPCYSQAVIPRRSRIGRLEETILRLESDIALLSKSHTRGLISQSLWDKLRFLRHPIDIQTESLAPSGQLALWPYATAPITAAPTYATGRVLDEEMEAGYTPAVPSQMMDQMIGIYAPSFDGGPLPGPFSLWMWVSLRFHHRVIRRLIKRTEPLGYDFSFRTASISIL